MAKTWNEIKENIKSISEEEKIEIDLLASIVSVIIQRRNEIGLSQRDLAEMSGIKQSAIARLESLRTTPQIDTLYKVLKPLGLKIQIVPEN